MDDEPPIDHEEIEKRVKAVIDAIFGTEPYVRVLRPEYQYARLYYFDRGGCQQRIYFRVTVRCIYSSGALHVHVYTWSNYAYGIGFTLERDDQLTARLIVEVHQAMGAFGVLIDADTAKEPNTLSSLELANTHADVDSRYRVKID